ncbi:hypothetical protein [Methylobacterium planeticum]|nr:hypothetical protein [Methylobacterium planeticum]
MSALPEAVDVPVVADASLMPRPPSASTNVPTVMIALTIADTLGPVPA